MPHWSSSLRGGIAKTSGTLDVKLSGEVKALDAKLSGDIKALGAKVALIDKRLAVVENHVLGNRSIVEGGSLEETQAL